MELNGSHSVASAAARLCRGRHDHFSTWEHPACPECWDVALQADKEAATAAGLPEVCEADPNLVDEVAVARAVAGEPVELTVAEWRVAKVAVMRRRGVSATRARRLLSRHVTVIDALGAPIESPLLAAVVAGHVSSPARVVALAASRRLRRRSERRAAFFAAAGAAGELVA
ncbi:hypothetical protein [Glycomyces sp. MUSA5-2]|uniref:hypothetical protein n=1 Tax=Glycomyces sp. MUSA5-2 TaxID=2053002 RepID=UPI00300A0A41